ncbi:hypothetical protein [Sphingobacterium sp. MYb388]|uniref:hypothetical protein n=1 Tax=Sphingobacterium sp. MYb388 TaxID=2745437 RepID=UPI0030AFB8F1
MNNLELKSIGVQELDTNEMVNIDGGKDWWGIAKDLLISAIDNWGDIREGWEDGGKGNPRY